MTSTSTVPRAPQDPDIAAFVQPFDHPILLKYFSAVRNFHGAIKFLGMGSMREKVTKDVHLDSLFVMPRLSSRHVTAAESVGDPSTLKDTQPLLDAVRQHQRLVVLGDPGSGKSTLIQYLSEGLCRTLDSSVRNALGPMVPLPIILRELKLSGLMETNEFESLLEAWLDNNLRPVSAAFQNHSKLLHSLFATGQALVLIDGLDEVSDESLRHVLCQAIWRGMDKYPRARWIITSRIVGYSAVEIHQHVFRSGAGARITSGATAKSVFLQKEGTTEESTSVKFGSGFSTNGERINQVAALAYVAPFNQAQIKQFARNWMLAMGDNEQDAARNTTNFTEGISERPATRLLAPTPVLLTFMGLVYRGSRDFPNGRAELFRLIVRAYVENIEKDKFGCTGIPAGLNVHIVEHLLDQIGWEAQLLRVADSKLNETQRELLIPENTLRLWMRTSLQNVLPNEAVDSSIAALLRYLAERTGLIVPRGRIPDTSGHTQEHYSFLHLSIQEFMAARWLVERMTDDDWMDRERLRKNTKFRKTLPPDSLPFMRERTRHPEWHEVFFLLHELWQKPTPLFRLFAADPWVHVGSTDAISSLRATIVPSTQIHFMKFKHDYLDSQRSLLAAIALDESNGLALQRELRFQLFQAIHGSCCRNWTIHGLQLSLMLLRQGDLFDMSWHALLAELPDSPCLFLPSCPWIDEAKLNSICQMNDRLEALYLGSLVELKSLSALRNLKNLKHLILNNCAGLKDILALQNLTSLQTLDLSDCNQLTDLEALRRLTKLKQLHISRCSDLTDLSPLFGLTNLKQLYVFNCPGLGDPQPHFADIKKALPHLEVFPRT